MGVGAGEIKIKDHLSPAEAETWTELGNTALFNVVYLNIGQFSGL